jgi:hypothetical protein
MAREYRRFNYAHMQHHAVFDALVNRQGARAEAIMREHANATLRYAEIFSSAVASERMKVILRRRQISSTSSGVFEREQQGVNWSLHACSSSVRNRSRWSGMPSSTRSGRCRTRLFARHGDLDAMAFQHLHHGLVGRDLDDLPLLATLTLKLPSWLLSMAAAAKYSRCRRSPAHPCPLRCPARVA